MEQVLHIRPTTRTLLVTGHGDHDMRVKALKAGAYPLIPKPIERGVLPLVAEAGHSVATMTSSVEEQNVRLTWLNRVDPDARARVAQESHSAMWQERDENMEFRIVHPDGVVRWMHRQGQLERDARGQAFRGAASPSTSRTQTGRGGAGAAGRDRQLLR